MEPVDLALCLAVDASSSVDHGEFGLMLGGTAAAFRDPAIGAALAAGPAGATAVALLMWSGPGAQAVALGWTRLDGPAAAASFGEAVDNSPRLVPPGGTALGEGMAAGIALLGSFPGEARRLVLDVSGDGRHNQGRPPGPVRDIGVAGGITINALAVLNEEPDLLDHYTAEVIGGLGSFAMPTPDYEAFAEAIRAKLHREIGGAFIA